MQSDIVAALIVDNDTIASRRLRRVLEELGYAVRQEDESAAALALLAGGDSSFVTFLDVELPRNRMSGLDHADLIGEVLRDEHLREQHTYIVITESPDTVAMTLGRLLQQLSIPIIAKPLSMGSVRAAIAGLEAPASALC
jgi:CheY-like chemotaxis protein